jgi:plastocyanin domain-containing protein
MKKKAWFLTTSLVLALATPFAVRGAAPQTVDLKVTDKGFEPHRVKVTKGEPLKLVVTRKTDATCAKEITIPSENIRAELPLDKPVTLAFTPKKTGDLQYSCAMGMIGGVFEVQ